jgi:hypothetical protein
MTPPTDPLVPNTSNSSELESLIRRAQGGDRSAVPALRTYLDQCPELWREAGDLSRLAEKMFIVVAARQNLYSREAIARKLAELKQELAPASPVEQLLVDRVAVTWLALQIAESDATFAREKVPEATPYLEHLERRLTGAQTRYLAALRTYATVKKLLARTQPRGKAVSPAAKEPNSVRAGKDAQTATPAVAGWGR